MKFILFDFDGVIADSFSAAFAVVGVSERRDISGGEAVLHCEDAGRITRRYCAVF